MTGNPVRPWWCESIVTFGFHQQNFSYYRSLKFILWLMAKVPDIAQVLCNILFSLLWWHVKSCVIFRTYYCPTEPPYLPDGMPSNSSVVENDHATLTCPAKGTPNPRVKWFKDGRLITGNELSLRLLPDGSLLIEHSEARDSGQYTCVAENVAGNTSHTIDFEVFCKFYYYAYYLVKWHFFALMVCCMHVMLRRVSAPNWDSFNRMRNTCDWLVGLLISWCRILATDWWGCSFLDAEYLRLIGGVAHFLMQNTCDWLVGLLISWCGMLATDWWGCSFLHGQNSS